MLTPGQKKKLQNRATTKGPELHYNDMQVRRALKKYLADSEEALMVMNTLPDEKIASLLNDIPEYEIWSHIDNLFLVIERILYLSKARKITKEMVLAGEVSDVELRRALLTHYHCSDIEEVFGPYGDLGEVMFLYRGYIRDKNLKDWICSHLDKDGMKIFDRLRAALPSVEITPDGSEE